MAGRVRRRVMKFKKVKELFFTFLKIGTFTFGGGYAMIPLIKREIVEKKQWLDEKEIFDIIAIAESTPGPMAVNSATFVGSKISGVAGALSATLGVVLPSFFIISLLANVLLLVENNTIVQSAFFGIRAGVLVLIGSALVTLYRQMKKDVLSYIIMITAFLLVCIFKVNTIIVLFISGFSGCMWSMYIKKIH